MSDTQLSIVAKLETKKFQSGISKMKNSVREFARTDAAALGAALGTVAAAATTLGVKAVQAAAQMETLETSFVSLTGGAVNAAKAIEQLNEFTASTPFQLEAVATAARQLLAAGSGVEDLNTQLGFLGDIAATTGQPINEIAAIFSKVNAKGKVELENLNQLAERGIPIFTALSEATGLLPSELGAGAVSVEQFNATLKSFAEEGGFAAGAMERLSKTTEGKFSTAMDNIKLATAEVGKALKPLADAILDIVIGLAKWLQANPALLRGLGRLIGLTAGVSAFAAAVTLLSGALTIGLGPAALIVGGVATAVGALLFNVRDTSDEVKKFNLNLDSQKRITEELKKTIGEAAAETNTLKQRASSLIAQYKASEGDTERQTELLGLLRDVHPQLAEELDATKASTEDLDTAMANLNTTLDSALAKLTQTLNAQAISNEINRLQSEVGKQLAPIIEEGISRGVTFDFEFNGNQLDIDAARKEFIEESGLNPEAARNTFDVAFAPLFRDANKELPKLQGRIDKLNASLNGEDLDTTPVTPQAVLDADAEVAAYEDSQKRLEELGVERDSELEALTAKEGIYTKAALEVDKESEAYRILKERIEDVQRVRAGEKQENVNPLQIKDDGTIDTGLEPKLITDGVGLAARQAATKLIADNLQSERESIISSWKSLGEDMASALRASLANGLTQLGTAIGDLLSGASDFSFLSLLGDMLITLGKIAIQAGISMKAIKNLFKEPTTAILAGVAAVAIGTIAKNQAEAAVPAFAEGGAVLGPTLALVGEKPGSRGEAIVPFEKIGQFVDMVGGGNSGTQHVVVSGNLRGTDIELSSRRGARRRSRRH